VTVSTRLRTTRRILATFFLLSLTLALAAENSVIAELDRKTAVEAVASQSGYLLVDFYADW
jgi:hypothetical protein